MAREQTFAKRLREMEKKRKVEEKRKRRRKKKEEQANGSDRADRPEVPATEEEHP